jgi:carbonic anhydrase
MKRIHFYVQIIFINIFLQFTLEGAMSSQEALKKLLDGNERYTADHSLHPNRNAERREEVSTKQEPFAIIIGCSDSRVSPEIIFDQGVGDLFIVRVAGNVIGPIELSSVLYSVEYLHSSLIFVLGHESCGAVQAVLSHQTQDIEPIAAKIEKAIRKNKINFSSNPLENAIKANVHWVVQDLANKPIISKLIQEKKLEIAGGYYHLGSGKVELCCDINN